MAHAPPFMDPSSMGLDHITGANSTDLLQGVLVFWRSIGVQGHWSITTVVFGVIPIILGLMVLMRYQKIIPAIVTSLFGLMMIMAVEVFYFDKIGALVHPVVSWGMSIAAVIALTIALFNIGGEKV